jgi:hypothetical protein
MVIQRLRWLTAAAVMMLPIGGCAQPRAAADPVADLLAGSSLLVWDGMLFAGFELRPEDAAALHISSVEAVAPAEAVRRWGERGANGAVVVTTRAAPAAPALSARVAHIESLLGYFESRDPAPPPQILIARRTPRDRALIMLDGRLLGRDLPAEDLDALTVQRIEVFRGAVAGALYGSISWFGVIALSTR